MLVLFGLNATQSALYEHNVSLFFEIRLTISIVNNRVLDQDILTPVCVPTICVLCDVRTMTGTSNIDVIENDIGRVRHEMVVLG